MFKNIKKQKKQKNLDRVFLNMCVEFSSLSKCVSHQVACLFVKDNRIISSGVNGSSSGYLNCNEVFNKKNFDRKKHHEFSENYEIHSEINAILSAAKNGISINGCTAYVTLEPCFNCSKNLSMSGIKRIVYLESYDLFPKELIKTRNEYLKKVNVSLEKY